VRAKIISKSFLIIPVSAVIIISLCAYKMNKEYPERKITGHQEVKQLAPVFELFSEKNQTDVIRLRGYLGRHRLLIAFYDGNKGVNQSPTISSLKANYDLLEKKGVIVFGISEEIPQVNRKIIKETGKIPFRLLSDPGFNVIRQWGCYDEEKQATVEKVFLIDRTGYVRWEGEFPKEMDSLEEFYRTL
jgi:peroxiredoxin